MTGKPFNRNVSQGLRDINLLFEKKYKTKSILVETLKKEVDIHFFFNLLEKFLKSVQKKTAKTSFLEKLLKLKKPIERKNKKNEDEILLFGLFSKKPEIHCNKNHEKKIKN